MHQAGRTRKLIALLALVAIGACGGSDDSTAPSQSNTSLNLLVTGNTNGQSAAVGSKLPYPIAVTVVNGNGSPQSGVAVSWSVISGGGSLSNSTTVSDEGGLTFVDWTLGSVPGTDSVRASVENGPSVIFTAKATNLPATAKGN